jgi:hypothetical protein
VLTPALLQLRPLHCNMVMRPLRIGKIDLTLRWATTGGRG